MTTDESPFPDEDYKQLIANGDDRIGAIPSEMVTTRPLRRKESISTVQNRLVQRKTILVGIQYQ